MDHSIFRAYKAIHVRVPVPMAMDSHLCILTSILYCAIPPKERGSGRSLEKGWKLLQVTTSLYVWGLLCDYTNRNPNRNSYGGFSMRKFPPRHHRGLPKHHIFLVVWFLGSKHGQVPNHPVTLTRIVIERVVASVMIIWIYLYLSIYIYIYVYIYHSHDDRNNTNDNVTMTTLSCSES